MSDNYHLLVRVNWNDSDKEPLEFIKRFTSGWPDDWSPEDLVSKVTELGGLMHDNIFYPLHTIENIEFEKPLPVDD